MLCTGVDLKPCVYTIRHGRMRQQYVDVMSFYPYIFRYFKFPWFFRSFTWGVRLRI